MIHHYNILVKGKVQGVSFRFSAQAKAMKLDLVGFVKNNFSGDVYIEAEGTEDNINKLIQWCQAGPPLAEVSEVNASEAPLKNFKTFELKK